MARWLAARAGVVLVACALMACSRSQGLSASQTGGVLAQGGSSNGGTVATGGSIGSGGLTTTGGRMGTGGTVATGGSIGSGGLTATGGRMGTGGTVATGGSIGSGGLTATGGRMGTGGTTAAGGTSGPDGGGADTGNGPPCTTSMDSSSFSATGSICVVLVRVSDDCADIIGYQLNCGNSAGTITEAKAREPLMSISSINWSVAPLVSDPTTTGVYVFASSGPSPAWAVGSALTGNQLVYLAFGAYHTPSAWLPGTDLGGVCANAPAVSFTEFGSTGGTATFDKAIDLLRQRGLFVALRSRWGTSGDFITVGQVTPSTGPEYLVLITATMRA